MLKTKASMTGGAFFATLLTVALLAKAQQQQPAPSKTAGQTYKNLQVLQDEPADELNMTMHNISGQLGVDCDFCHAGHGDLFALDDKPQKKTARQMIRMVQEINKSNFAGRQAVTCYTCHRGHPEPVGMVTLPLPSFEEAFEEPKPLPQPGADEILANYVRALGGEQALRKITSRVITATKDVPTAPGGVVPVPAAVQQFFKAPNLSLEIDRTPTFTISSGFDGAAAWTQDMAGVIGNVVSPVDQGRIKRAADFYECLNLKQEYPRMAAAGVERINDRDAYVVNAFPQGDSRERLYFDVQTGLLLRKISTYASGVGDIPSQVDYDDYRDTGSGVKYPFLIRMTPATPRSDLETVSTIRVQKVQDNAAIDDGKFERPASK